MEEQTKTEGNASGVAVGLFIVIVGIVISFIGIGAILGVPLIIYGLFQGGKKKYLWVCPACGYFFERAK